MSGIKLKSEELTPLKLERIKWIGLLFLSHIFSFLLASPTVTRGAPSLPIVRVDHARLKLKIDSQVPQVNNGKDVIIITSEKDLISRRARLIKKVQSQNSLDSSSDLFLVEIPETDLNNLIHKEGKNLIAYPSSSNIQLSPTKQRSKKYEIHF